MTVDDIALGLEVKVSLVAVDLYEGPGLGGGGTPLSPLLLTGIRPIEIGGGARFPGVSDS